MDEYMNGLAAKAAQVIKRNPGDYVVDGILRCGICGMPKETVLEGGIKVPCRCKCGEEKLSREKALKEEAENNKRRELCFTTEKPKTYRIDHLDGKTADIAKAYMDNWQEARERGAGLFLWGDVGVGKTYLAAAIANAVIDRGGSARMKTTGEIILEASDAKDKMSYINELVGVSLLVIDDLGTERGTAYGAEILHTLINRRCDSGRPLIITSNIPLAELKSEQDVAKKRLFDRVLGVCVPVQIIGKSRRPEMGSSHTAWLRDKLGLS